MLIDYHAHALPYSFKKAIEKLKIDSIIEDDFELPSWSIEEHLKFMTKSNIDLSILSIPNPNIYEGEQDEVCNLIHSINEELSIICSLHYDKFKFVGCLPLLSIDKSICELDTLINHLGAIGIKLPSSINGLYLGDSYFDELFKQLDEKNALVIIHPVRPKIVPKNCVTGSFGALFEYPVDTTRAILNMIVNNVMVRFPNVKFVVPHVGSFLPYMKDRLSGMMKIIDKFKKVDIEANINKLYFDIAGDPEINSLDILLKITDKSRILYGSDYPHANKEVIISKKQSLFRNKVWIESALNINGESLLNKLERKGGIYEKN